MKLLYNAGIALYGIGAKIAALRSDKARRFVEGRKNALDELARLTTCNAPHGYDYWFHVASLGEFEQARPLIEKIRAEQGPDVTILLTFFSPSGYEVRKNYPAATTVTYLPADTTANARRLLDIARPRVAIFVKYEFWVNLLLELSRRNVPTYLISAIFRPGQIFFRPWGGLFRKTLRCYRHLYVQDEASRRLLSGINIDNVTVTGDTRFDRVNDIRLAGREFPSLQKWTEGHFTIVAGSSWGPDEERYIPWLNENEDARIIIAPHEFDKVRLKALQNSINGKSVFWSELPDDKAIDDNVKVVVIDTFGILSSLYRYADTVIVGGGFGAGIHNINEAAVWGTPVLIGPRHAKFKEATDLITLGGAFEYNTAHDIKLLLDRFKNDKEARNRAAKASADYIADNLGATDAILGDIIPASQR